MTRLQIAQQKICLGSLLALSLILVMTIYLRFESVANTEVINPVRADARDYFMYAYNLRHNHVYAKAAANSKDPISIRPDSVRTPGYPIFLLPFVDGLPNQQMLGEILIGQAFLSVLAVAAAFFFFRGFLQEPWALLACFLTALSPHLIVVNSYLLTETLFGFVLLLFAWLISSLRRSSSSRIPLVFAGIALGFATLVRPSLQYFPLIMAFLLLFQFGWRRGTRSFIVFVIGFFLVFAPWLVRNLIVLHSPGDRTLMINFLHHGMYPDFTYHQEPRSYGFPYRFDPRSTEIRKDLSSVVREIAERFKKKPFEQSVWFLIGKPIAFWSWDIVQGVGDIFIYPVGSSPYFDNKFFQLTHDFMHFLHWPLVCLGLLSSFLVWISFFETVLSHEAVFVARFTSLLILYFTLLHMIGVPFPRYSVPLRPFIYGMAMLQLQVTANCIKRVRLSDQV